MERQEVLDAIRRRVQEEGGTLVRTVKDLAGDLGVGSPRLYYLLKSFEQKGELVTHSRGPKGLEIRLPDGDVATPRRPRAARRPRRAVAAAAAPGEKYYCPWCGGTVQVGWRYCVSCGEKLPGPAAPSS